VLLQAEISFLVPFKEGEKEETTGERTNKTKKTTKAKNKNRTFSVQEVLFYTKLAFPTLTPRVHARLDKPNIECWERVCGGV
jgi:hypothetical protein